nr:lactate racemase domain-containing protein [Fervidobacterium pennivorans]
MCCEIKLKYNKETEISLKGDFHIDVIVGSSKQAISPTEIEKKVSSILSPDRLKGLINLRGNVSVLIDDHTRGTPVHIVLPHLYESLRRLGITKDQITVVVATGTHRKMTAQEMKAKMGDSYTVFNLIQHSCFEDLVLLNDIDGIPVLVNKLVAHSENIIGIGSIVAHKYSGWSGGAKIICPGVCGYETVYLSHARSIVIEQVQPGQFDNWYRRFINTVARNLKTKMIVDFIPTTNGVLDVVGGDPVSVFRYGVREAENFLVRKVNGQADITVLSAYPSTKDLWQTGKAFYIGDLVTKSGGTMIILSPLEDGRGDHGEYLNLLHCDLKDLLNAVHKRVVDDPLAIVAAIATKRILRKKRIVLLTDNRNFENKKIDSFEIIPMSVLQMEEYLSDLLSSTNNDYKIVVIGDSYVLPKVGGENT